MNASLPQLYSIEKENDANEFWKISLLNISVSFMLFFIEFNKTLVTLTHVIFFYENHYCRNKLGPLSLSDFIDLLENDD